MDGWLYGTALRRGDCQAAGAGTVLGPVAAGKRQPQDVGSLLGCSLSWQGGRDSDGAEVLQGDP